MKAKYIIIMLAAALAALSSCRKMNDNIDQYLSKGEIIYIAKPDSVHLFAGKERFKMEFWLRDPRATQMQIYLTQKSEPIKVTLDKDRSFDDPVTVVVNEGVTEGQYSLKLITHDANGNTSVPDEENVTVYGDNFQASLNNRLVDSKSVKGNVLTINWGNCYSLQEVAIRVWYTDTAGGAKEVTYKTESLDKSSVISDIDVSREVTYSTLYLPETTAIDTFFTSRAVIAF